MKRHKKHETFLTAYLTICLKFPFGFRYRDISQLIEPNLSLRGSRVGNYLNQMKKHGLIIKKGKKWIPQFFKCNQSCRMFLVTEKTLEELKELFVSPKNAQEGKK